MPTRRICDISAGSVINLDLTRSRWTSSTEIPSTSTTFDRECTPPTINRAPVYDEAFREKVDQRVVRGAVHRWAGHANLDRGAVKSDHFVRRGARLGVNAEANAAIHRRDARGRRHLHPMVARPEAEAGTPRSV